MPQLLLRKFHTAIIAITLLLMFTTIWESAAQKTLSSLSGRVIDADGKPVAGLKLAIKPVKFSIGINRDLKQRTPFSSWLRVVTDTEGRFAFHNIDPVSSQFTMFPEHGSDYEIVSIEIGDLTIYSTAFRQNFPFWFGKLTFSVEPGEHLQNMIVNVTTPRMRIRGRVLSEDGTPIANEQLWLKVKSFRPSPSGRSGGSSGRNVRTDNQGYFVTYYPRGHREYTLRVTYQGMFAQSEKIILEGGERYDDLVFVLNNIESKKAREAVWIVNPANGNAYKKIQCNSWDDAKAKAAAENAYLVAINDEAEQKWLKELFSQSVFFWIGLSVPENKTSWQWNNGQPLTYTNWRTGQEPDKIAIGGGKGPVAMEFAAKRWLIIDPKSPFLPAVKHAILEKDKINLPIPKGIK